MLGRLFNRILRAQYGWARPLGDFNVRWIGALLRPVKLIKDFLDGTWLGHSLHVVLTDLPLGALSLTVLFDLLDLRTAADISLAVGVLGMLAAAVTGAADYADTDDDPRAAATVHAVLMVTALVLYIASFWLRTPLGDRTVPIILELIAYGIMLAGAFIGGELVFGMGNMVNRHAWRFGPKSNWAKLDVTDIPENKPTAAKAGTQSLVVARTS
jgi:hypothetical protein